MGFLPFHSIHTRVSYYILVPFSTYLRGRLLLGVVLLPVEKNLQSGRGTDEQNKNKKTDEFILVKGKKKHIRAYAKGYVAADLEKNTE